MSKGENIVELAKLAEVHRPLQRFEDPEGASVYFCDKDKTAEKESGAATTREKCIQIILEKIEDRVKERKLFSNMKIMCKLALWVCGD